MEQMIHDLENAQASLEAQVYARRKDSFWWSMTILTLLFYYFMPSASLAMMADRCRGPW